MCFGRAARGAQAEASDHIVRGVVVGGGIPIVEKEAHLEVEIDELDRRIITELQDNGRKPSTEIARRLVVPFTNACHDRVDSLGLVAGGPE